MGLINEKEGRRRCPRSRGVTVGKQASNDFPLLFLVGIPPPRLLFLFVPVQDKGQVQVNDKEWLLGTTGCCSWHSKNATPSPHTHTTVAASKPAQHFPNVLLVASPCWDRNTWVSLPYAYAYAASLLRCMAMSHSHPCPCLVWWLGMFFLVPWLGSVCGRCLLA